VTAATCFTHRARLLLLAVAASLASLALLAAPHIARAQSATQPTAIAIAAPASAQLGDLVTVKAKLVDAAGNAFPKAAIDFASPATFLNHSGDMVVASALTDAQGVATAQFQVRTSGALTLKAVFRGDTTYAAAEASTQLTVSGSKQLYEQDVLPSVPGINAAPIGGLATSGSTRWLLTGWPIAAVLILVWSSYAMAVVFMSRIARESSAGDGTSTGAAAAASAEQGAGR
jgi:hypothetical protein